jgi:transposase
VDRRRLQTVSVDETIIVLRALVEHRDDVVKTRTQTLNRLHVLLTRLVPGGAPRELDATKAAQLLRPIRPRDAARQTLRRLAVDLIAEIRHLDRRIATANTQIAQEVRASGTTLTDLRGIATLNAAKILARVGDIRRFRSAAAFASYTGTAPIEVSSGDVVRHRLSRAGDRQLNYCLHTMATPRSATQDRVGVYYQRKRASGKGHKGSPSLSEEAAVRLGLSPADPRQHPPSHSGSGRTLGGVYEIRRGRLNPYHRLFGSVTSRTHRRRPYNHSKTHHLTQRGAV